MLVSRRGPSIDDVKGAVGTQTQKIENIYVYIIYTYPYVYHMYKCIYIYIHMAVSIVFALIETGFFDSPKEKL